VNATALRRLTEKPTHNGFPFGGAVAIPLLLSTRRTHRSRPSFNRTLRLTSTSAASAAAAPKGSKHYSGPGSYGAPVLN
jgi:hypothetical protein